MVRAARPRAAISPDHRAQIEPVDHLDHKTRQMTRAMEMHVLAECEPHVAFGLVGAEIVEDEVDFALRKSGDDVVHEVEGFGSAASFVMATDDCAARQIERGEPRRRPVAFVIVPGSSMPL